MVREMCGVLLKHRKGVKDFMMLGLNETIVRLAMANNVELVWSCIEKGIGH